MRLRSPENTRQLACLQGTTRAGGSSTSRPVGPAGNVIAASEISWAR
jgi:hypothetical protein